MSLYFDSREMPDPEKSYVLYIDIMGTQTVMTRSFKRASNFIFKMHVAILQTLREIKHDHISVYPLVDGAYITSKYKGTLIALVSNIYYKLVNENVNTQDFLHWFLVRGGISYGDIIHGYNVPYSASWEYSNSVGYKEKILIGSAMTDAYATDKSSPPMGISICRSAAQCQNAFSPDWKWYDCFTSQEKLDKIDQFKNKLSDYYGWLERNYNEYPTLRREEHRAKAFEYFRIGI